jgi:serine/threonine-protein kinase
MLPIATDTILQQRYRVIDVLGEGGFGRTYLATDRSRFEEQCAIKELLLTNASAAVVQRARDFFQSEAVLLYKLQHPQIPRFWATFEESDRLFLVQDYIHGQTYESLLEDKKATGRQFTEAEVWRFLLQVLPVLGYIHSQGVVHRDISPDNIILRDNDLLPVLIDFGVVKALASQLKGMDGWGTKTVVGKPGFAPVEQMRSGTAYPSSDIYSLGVTAIVLLTGKDPSVLFMNDKEISWGWRDWVSVTDGFANVLQMMLAVNPTERYQSAVDVFQALQPLSIPVDRQPEAPISRRDRQPRQNDRIPSGSGNTAAMALGSLPRQQPPKNKVYTRFTEIDLRSIWEQPKVFIPLAAAIAIAAFAGTFFGIQLMRSGKEANNPTPIQSFSNPTVANTTAKPSGETNPEVITLNVNNPIVKNGVLKGDTIANYRFYGSQNQDIILSLEGNEVLMTIANADSTPIDDKSTRVTSWQGKLPATGEYKIELKPIAGGERDRPFPYKLIAILNPPPAAPVLGGNPTGVPTVNPTAGTPTGAPPFLPANPPEVRVSPATVPNSGYPPVRRNTPQSDRPFPNTNNNNPFDVPPPSVRRPNHNNNDNNNTFDIPNNNPDNTPLFPQAQPEIRQNPPRRQPPRR